jgi:uncharacterized protein (DUF433 family)
MNKYLKTLAAVLALLVVAGSTMAFAQVDETMAETTAVLQQDDTPSTDRPQIVDPEAVKAAIADTLGISMEELEAAREEGTKLPELAEELGVDIADVEAAIQAVRAEAIDQALADGLITAEQAERLLNQDGRPGPGGGRRGPQIFDREAMEAATADALGISVEELQAAREEGTTIPELAEELGVDMANVQAAVQAAREDAINQALADGTITAEQAERLLNGECGPHHRGPRGNNTDGEEAVPVEDNA